ncbi:MAG TPA: hypothetical protein VGK19_20015 [Capsulimonadaceae bacterium]
MRSASCKPTAAPILATSPDPHDPVGFGGQYAYYTDSDTGLVLCTHRYYDPLRRRGWSRRQTTKRWRLSGTR